MSPSRVVGADAGVAARGRAGGVAGSLVRCTPVDVGHCSLLLTTARVHSENAGLKRPFAASRGLPSDARCAAIAFSVAK